MIFNRQDVATVKLPALRAYTAKLRSALALGGKDFNVCLVTDQEIKRLNTDFRGVRRPSDVLSFPWKEEKKREKNGAQPRDFNGFLGDVVISVETARRNAHAEGHSLHHEIQWLILHGLLHLLGYDHETDRGEMNALEVSLRRKLGI